MASVLTTAAKHAHAVATALLSNAPVTPGGAIPDITLKEENPEAGSVNLKSLPGKIIIVSNGIQLCTRNPLTLADCHRLAFQELSPRPAPLR